MRKLWLTFTAMLLCSIASFAQTRDASNRIIINSPAEFLKIGTTGYSLSDSYILTEDINLGTYHADNNNFVIEETFTGTFNGDNNTITYKGSFTVTADGEKVGLFESVSGTITNLNLNADITVSGDKARVKVGLLCGQLENSATAKIEFCDVTGNINSTAKSGGVGNGATGLIIGNNLGDLQYCTGHGNVTGIGYAGGLVGSMGTIMEGCPSGSSPLIRGCYFTGNVTANNSDSFKNVEWLNVQSYGGGICGTIRNPAKIELCVAEAIVVVGQNAAGITTTTIGNTAFLWGNCGTAQNNYATGTINGSPITSNTLVNQGLSSTSNPTPNNNPNYPTNNVTDLQTIINNLEAKRGSDNHFYFTIINGKIVLVIGQPQEEQTICEAPINLSIMKNEDGTYSAIWSVANEDNTAEETSFVCKLNGVTIQTSPTFADGFYLLNLGEVGASNSQYTFSVESNCSATQNDLYSDAVTYSFYVNECNTINTLLTYNISATAATVNWQGTAYSVELNGEPIEFNGGNTLFLTNLSPANTYTISVISECILDGETSYLPTSVTFTTHGVAYETAKSGDFNNPNTWSDGSVPPADDIANIIINEGHRVIVGHNLVITDSYKITDNKGVLQITQQGQLINTTGTNVPGIIEIVSSQKETQAWTFIGAPFQPGYKLETIVPVPGNDADGISDISVKKYDYEKTNDNGNAAPGWSDSWAHIDTEMKAGEGYFGYPFYGGVVTFTTYGDVCTWDNTNGRYVIGSYNFENAPVTALNNDVVTITETISATQDDPETIGVSEAGNWMALSNPYPAKLKASKFVSDNGGNAVINGNCVYVFKNGAFDMPSNDEIAMTEGFFVNFSSTGEKTITFNKGQLSYNNQSAKASANEFIKLTLINGDKKVRAYLAHNENAEQGYDIFDANKLFAPTEIAEPYFVTDGIALMKEEFAELPYYATMNVRSFADDTVSFVVENIPEGYSVSIIDGENIIDMVEGGVYSTEILTGENADRFKVLIKKSVSISDVEELEVNITNNNRHISIETTETDLQVEVYNALGQKVLSTKDRNFTLNQVSAGAYLIKAFNNKASKTQKIVVE